MSYIYWHYIQYRKEQWLYLLPVCTVWLCGMHLEIIMCLQDMKFSCK